MNLRIRFLPTLAIAGAAVALVVGGLTDPVLAGDAIDEKIKAFEEYLDTKPDSQGLRNQIADLALAKDPRVAKTLKSLLRHKDDDVVIAVAQNIGEQGDPKIAKLLKVMADRKDMDENPKVMAALIEGVGEADAKGNYDWLEKTAKGYLDKNATIACAAFQAAAQHVTRDTVKFLIAELGRADYVTTSDNAVKKANRGKAKPVLLSLLKKVTGEQINDVKIWNEWWSDNKKTWKPPIPGEDGKADLNKKDDYQDSAYGFWIKKPSRAWLFRKAEGTQPYLTLEALDEGQRAAWVELTVVGTKNYQQKTAEAWADAMKGGLEGKFRDFKDAEWNKPFRIAGGKKGVEQVLFGQHKDFGAVQMHNVYVEEGEIMYQLVGVWKSGKSVALKDDIEEILRTFKLTR